MQSNIYSKSKVLGLINILIFTALTSIASPQDAIALPKKGYIQNSKGEKCWYSLSVKEKQYYFFEKKLTSNLNIVTFDNSNCMDGNSINDIDKKMINYAVSKEYSHSDANFITDIESMKAYSSSWQTKGMCIPSRTYPSVSVAVDYITNGKGYITQAIHSMAIECNKK
jgi:hypothetical protein